MNFAEIESAKYSELWHDVPDYRKYSPGMENVSRFIDIMKPDKPSTLLDAGCGTGEAGLEFEKLGMIVQWLDITDAGLRPDIPRSRFIRAPLWDDWNRHWKYGYDYGFCCDVMEHIPTEYSMLVIDRLTSVCRRMWFQIALVPDQFGAVIGQTLHLTVRPFEWWLDHMRETGANIVEARDLCSEALFVVEK